MGRAFASSVEGLEFELPASHVKDWKSGTCCFPG